MQPLLVGDVFFVGIWRSFRREIPFVGRRDAVGMLVSRVRWLVGRHHHHGNVVQVLLLREWGVQGRGLCQDDLLVRRAQGRGRRQLLLWCDGAAVGDAGEACCIPGTQCQNLIQGQGQRRRMSGITSYSLACCFTRSARLATSDNER